MGNGTISPHTLINVLMDAFGKAEYRVYISSRSVQPFAKDNIYVDYEFDFHKFMLNALTFINHGGQNSIMTGLVNGVPQIIRPGKVFERQYNAESVVRVKAGKTLHASDFTAQNVRQIVKGFETDTTYHQNALKVGENLLKLGGASKVIDMLEHTFG